MRQRLDITASNMVIVPVAIDIQIKCLAISNIQRDMVFFLTSQEGHGVQCKFEFGAYPNEARAYKLFNSSVKAM